MDGEKKIQYGHCPQFGFFKVALGGTFDPIDHIEQSVASFRDECLDVEGQPSLEDPEALEADGGAETKIGNEELGVDSEGDAEEGGERRDERGD